MSCYRPKKAFPLVFWNKDKDILEYEKTKNGKQKYYITEYSVKYIYMTKDGTWHKSYDDFRTKLAVIVQEEFATIPCGACVGCRLDHASMWSNRCMLEASYHEENYFVTLTYSEDSLNERVHEKEPAKDSPYLRRSQFTDEQTGEVLYPATLNKRDLQLFFKRLRKACEKRQSEKIRYFACGEYGSSTLRPHYHCIIFGLSLNDLVVHSIDARGYKVYTSEFLQNLWNLGFVTVGEVTPESCSYTARYCVKKAFKSNTLQSDLEVMPEFLLMSNRPGIGAKYYEEHPNIFDDEYIYLSTDSGGIKFKPPRYFEKLYDRDNHIPNLRRKIQKEDLALPDTHKRLVLSKTSLDYLTQLRVEEQNKINQIKVLKREL